MVSSSRLRNTNPLTVPGRWRTMTAPRFEPDVHLEFVPAQSLESRPTYPFRRGGEPSDVGLPSGRCRDSRPRDVLPFPWAQVEKATSPLPHGPTGRTARCACHRAARRCRSFRPFSAPTSASRLISSLRISGTRRASSTLGSKSEGWSAGVLSERRESILEPGPGFKPDPAARLLSKERGWSALNRLREGFFGLFI
jgi:hypothetical protein